MSADKIHKHEYKDNLRALHELLEYIDQITSKFYEKFPQSTIAIHSIANIAKEQAIEIFHERNLQNFDPTKYTALNAFLYAINFISIHGLDAAVLKLHEYINRYIKFIENNKANLARIYNVKIKNKK